MLKFDTKTHRTLIFLLLLCLLIFGLGLRYENIRNGNIVFDYDQNEDILYTYKLAVDHQLLVIGRAIYGDPRIHHGVFYYYYNFIPFIISNGNFFASVYWNIFFNTATLFTIFFLTRSMFKKNLPAILAAAIVAASSELIKFSNWLTIDTVAVSLIPLFFFGLWEYYQKKKWGLILSTLALGLSIQTDLSLIYLIPVFIIYWIIFKPKVPSLKLLLITFFVFITTISTLILTEIKLNFIGVKTLLNFSSTFSETQLPYVDRLRLFIQDFGVNFSKNLFPERPDLGILIAAVIILTALFCLFRNRKEKYGIYFLLLYLFSPAVTLLLGYHQKPWFLIGLSPAIALAAGFTISKLRYLILILPVMLLIFFNNTNIILDRPLKAYEQFDSIYDSTSYLAYQLKVIDYTYQNAGGKPFAVNAVTYPLYYNGLWSYLYNWYGKNNYGFTPTWLGGDQLHPYDLLLKPTGKEKSYYLLISETSRIPEIFKTKGKEWAKERGKFVTEKRIGGFTVQQYTFFRKDNNQ